MQSLHFSSKEENQDLETSSELYCFLPILWLDVLRHRSLCIMKINQEINQELL